MDRRAFLASTGFAIAAPTGAFAQGAADSGLIPGSPDDQSGGLARALADASGRPLFLPPGRYRVSGIELPEHAHLLGVPGATIIEQAGAEPILLGRALRHATLSGLAFEGLPLGRAARPLLDIVEAETLVVEDCALTGAGGIALSLTRAGGRVSGCRFGDIGGSAVFALDSRGLAVTGNTVADCGDNGIQVWTSEPAEDGSLVTGNRISHIRSVSGGTGQNGNAISVFRAGGVVVSGNWVEDCVYSAVRVNSGRACQIVGNNARRLGETAIFVEFAFDGAVVGNNVVDGASSGISITNFADQGGRLATCSGNLVRNLFVRPDGEGGFGIAAEGDAALTGNVVENAPHIGLFLGWGESLRDVAATGNLVRDCGIGIAVSVAPGAGAALIANNLISGAQRPIVGMKWHEAVADLTQEADRFPQISLSDNTIR